MRPGGQARRASISGIFEPTRRRFSAPLTGCSAGRMYRYIELRTLAWLTEDTDRPFSWFLAFRVDGSG